MKDDAKQAAHEKKHRSSKQDKSRIGRWKTKKFNTCKSAKDAKQAAHKKHKIFELADGKQRILQLVKASTKDLHKASSW